MGYLLKETLKTLCGVDQWSYAVFWKIGCQNPKLLIWEECYYGPASFSRISGNCNPDTSSISTESFNLRSGVLATDNVHLLVNKMMMDNYVNIMGEGLIGRVAFTGNHQWILSENYYRESHPPEVQKEVHQQFSAGIQTVTVIPVLPHGVVQFGSDLKIAENTCFVDDVLSLVLQLRHVPGALQSESYAVKDLDPKIWVSVPEYPGYITSGKLPLESNMANASSLISDSFNYSGCSARTYMFDGQTPFPLAGEMRNKTQSNVAAFQASSSSSTFAHGSIRCTEQQAELENGSQGHFMNSMPIGVLNSALRTSSGLISNSNEDSVRLLPIEANGLCQCESSNMNPALSMDSLSDGSRASCENITSKCLTSCRLKDLNLSKMETSFSDSVDLLTTNSSFAYCSGGEYHQMNKKFAKGQLNPCKEERQQNMIYAHDIPQAENNDHATVADFMLGFVEDDGKQKIEGQSHPVNYINYDDAWIQPQSGDDLFDMLGADVRKKMFSSCLNSCLRNLSARSTYNSDKHNSPSRTKIFSSSQENSNSGIFPFTGTDHLLDAVVSKVHSSAKSLDYNVSCRTTLTNMSGSSAPKASLAYGGFGVSDHVKGELLGIPKYLANAGAISSSSLRNESSKEDLGTFSQGSSIYDSWIEISHSAKHNNSVDTAYSNKPHEASKTKRKRLKPGENPRPRPKDRQMIQDRVKELREIVPNGAKCSIDALLERTIRHMLFLQSVTKHADKLKQTVESKITSKDGGMLLKDNLGGATWAYEVGSQSMVCPIIVEDLNQPRQMLVEMLCEERGLFLEIADIIRGLGLTILKGLMETRNDKIWAQFTVEANRNVTRMEIFLLLVRLLEQNVKEQCSTTQ